MSPFRRRLLGSGLAGLLLDGLLATLATWLVAAGLVRPLLPQPLVTLLIALILGGFSLVEIPLMVFALRRLAAERSAAPWLVLGLNAIYVFFAGVYGTPLLLLTGSLLGGWILCSLGLVRLLTSLLLVHPGGTPAGREHADDSSSPPAPGGRNPTEREHHGNP